MKKNPCGIFGRALLPVFFLCAMTATAYPAADPVVVELRYQSGVKFYNRGMYERAKEEFEKTLQLEPGHEEAQEYLKKIAGKTESGAAVEGPSEEVLTWQKDGIRLYRAKDYEGAIKVFDKIIEEKPIDKTASDYKERCETMISRRLRKEKKKEEDEKSREERASQEGAAAAKKQGRRALLEKRKEIAQERASAAAQKIEAVRLTEEREPAPRKAPQKNKGQETKEKKKGAGKKQVNPLDQFKDSKELFLKGVEHYGRKEYKEAIAVLKEVIEVEKKQKRARYTGPSLRFMEKAKKKMAAPEKENP